MRRSPRAVAIRKLVSLEDYLEVRKIASSSDGYKGLVRDIEPPDTEVRRGRSAKTAPRAEEIDAREQKFKKPAKEQRISSEHSSDECNWYFETIPPTDHDKARANKFFTEKAKPPKFLTSAARFMQVPESLVPEVAFVGRSNVGKSSLLNAIVGADKNTLLSRTSATPGFTKTMNFYGIGPNNGITLKKDGQGRGKIVGYSGLVLVDMPGYGEGSIASWGVEIMKYIQSRNQLRRVFVLLDAEHGVKDKDRSLLASLRLAGVSHQVILSKMDKLYIPGTKESRRSESNVGKSEMVPSKGSITALRQFMTDLVPEIKPPVGGGALGEILACSATKTVDGQKLGISHVRHAVLKAVGLDLKPVKKSQKIQRNQQPKK